MAATHRMPSGRAKPVSCQSCRARKLRCSRQEPCSNCTARGLSCEFLVSPKRSTGVSDTTHDYPGLLRRIERLEGLAAKQSPAVLGHRSSTQDGEFLSQAAASDNLVQPLLLDHSMPPGGDEDQDASFLENVATREDTLVGRSHPRACQDALVSCKS